MNDFRTVSYKLVLRTLIFPGVHKMQMYSYLSWRIYSFYSIFHTVQGFHEKINAWLIFSWYLVCMLKNISKCIWKPALVPRALQNIKKLRYTFKMYWFKIKNWRDMFFCSSHIPPYLLKWKLTLHRYQLTTHTLHNSNHFKIWNKHTF